MNSGSPPRSVPVRTLVLGDVIMPPDSSENDAAAQVVVSLGGTDGAVIIGGCRDTTGTFTHPFKRGRPEPAAHVGFLFFEPDDEVTLLGRLRPSGFERLEQVAP